MKLVLQNTVFSHYMLCRNSNVKSTTFWTFFVVFMADTNTSPAQAKPLTPWTGFHSVDHFTCRSPYVSKIFILVDIHQQCNPLMDIECKTKKTSYDEKPALEIDAQTEKNHGIRFHGIASSISHLTLGGNVFKTSCWGQVVIFWIIVDNIHSYAQLLTHWPMVKLYIATRLNLYWFGKW